MCDNKAENINRCSCKSGRISRFLIPAILLLLSEKPSHGYELTEKYTEFGFTEAGSDPGAIYRTLKLLDSEGFIKSKWDTDDPGPAKKIYSITDEGSELLSSWVSEIKERKKTFELFLKRYDELKL
ncbi:MAG: helix-turn-helix transcriptional regulator [Actinobacteria bacterium]|nr:helix-turn-helix transcriptional regulator [Actinomycetota bacterium]